MLLRISWLLVAVLAAPAALHADTLLVASNGVDGPACGVKTAPCRTITQAMANAVGGDVVEVGPGRYGDLNANGILGEAEEEAPGPCGCAVFVTKALTLRSRTGAEATVIEAGAATTGVELEAIGAIFGEVSRGFTIRGGASEAVRATRDGVRIAGNIATQNDFGFRLSSANNSEVVGNTAIGNAEAGFFVNSGSGSSFAGNRAIGNGGGFLILDDDVTLSGNVATGNESTGFHLSGTGHLFVSNVASGNGEAGLLVQNGTSGQVIRENTLVGNVGPGLYILGPPAELSGNNIFGNDPAENCGIRNESGVAIAAPEIFWGAPGGPGVNPADAVCDEGASTTTVEPVATKELKLKLKAPK